MYLIYKIYNLPAQIALFVQSKLFICSFYVKFVAVYENYIVIL